RATNCVDGFWSESGSFLTAFPLGGFTHQLKAQLCGYTGSSSFFDYPVLLALSTNIPGFDYATFASTNGADLRFTSEGGATIPHEVDQWDTNGTSYVWVQVPEVRGTGTCVVAQWGNPAVTMPPPGNAWDNDYVGVWHLGDDGGSGNFPDSANNNDASDEVGSDTVTSPGIIGEAQDFNGGANELVVANEPNFDFLGAMTISTWFRVEAFTGNWQALITKGEGNVWRIHRSNNTQNLAWSAGAGGDLTAPVNVDDGNWHHLTVTKSVANGKAVYLDGVQVAGDADTSIIGLNDNPMRIGENSDSGGRNWNGDIDEVRVSSVERSADWAVATWSNTVPGSTFICFDPVMPLAGGDFDLALTKSVNTNMLVFGTNLIYTLGVSNIGTAGVSGVMVTDVLPPDSTIVSSVPPVTMIVGQTNIFDMGFFSPGFATSIVINVSVTSTVVGPITNVAWVATSNTEVSVANNMDTAVTMLPDSDGDGLANPGDPDDDNDGFSDCGEMLANTDPLDPASFLWLRVMNTPVANEFDLIFPTALGGTYSIQGTTNLYTGPWQVLHTGIPGTGGQVMQTDTNNSRRIYYRVGVQ
ncbi:MAG: DUF2341 domain-containing protein, partial [Verrucomicrobiota bacterium]